MTDKESKKKFRISWGTGLTIAIVCFMSLTLGVVFFASNLDFQMVTDNHYEKAVHYQQHIEEVEHAEALNSPVTIKLIRQQQEIEIHFPSSLTKDSLSGSIQLYRPSNAARDQKIVLAPDQQGIQHIDTSELSKGKWEIKLSWTAGSKRYFKQQNIFL